MGAASNGLAVDHEGNPAFKGYGFPQHLYYRQQGKWLEIGGCTHGLAFGQNGTLYRTDCNRYVHKYTGDGKWEKLSSLRKAGVIGGGKGGLWINDKRLYKWEEGKFRSQGGEKASSIAVGDDSHVLVIVNHKIRIISTGKLMSHYSVISITIGKLGRTYIVSNNHRVYKQTGSEKDKYSIR